MSTPSLLLLFGNQLFHPRLLPDTDFVFLAESDELCTYYQFHKAKITFFLSAMRHYRDELLEAERKVLYHELSASSKVETYEDLLKVQIQKNRIKRLICFEIEDKFMEKRIAKLAADLKLEFEVLESPNFMVSREKFAEYLGNSKKPFMKTFYESQRRGLKILMDSKGKPVGGQYSFDADNRKKLPTSLKIPAPKIPAPDDIDQAVMKMVEKRFKNHPGTLKDYWVPTSRTGAKAWATQFFKERFFDFGPYEDAFSSDSDFVFHSGLSPMINVGLLNPQDVVKAALKAQEAMDIPLASVEGYIRQVIGWREFIRGIYQNYSEQQETTNFFKHTRKLTSAWYDGTTGIPPLDAAIRKVVRLGFNHHIERLMVISNMMNLCQIHPQEAHRWFMEMYVDSSDWVMGPNVYGMGLMSDGGIFATKPYICGSNYILKMSSEFKKGEWCDIMDGLYWSFVDRNRKFFGSNPRMGMMVSSLDKMKPERKAMLFREAKDFTNRVTKE